MFHEDHFPCSNEKQANNDDVKLGFGLSELYIPPVPVHESGLKANSEFRKFCEEVYATLHSQIQGYNDVCDLMRNYNSDTGEDPLEMAQKFGFNSFRDFLLSDEMKDYVEVMTGPHGEQKYHAKEKEQFNHIRQMQLDSFNYMCEKRSRREGLCDWKRMRPKLFEVTKINGSYDGNVNGGAAVPDVLFKPGPAANQRRSVFDEDEEEADYEAGRYYGRRREDEVNFTQTMPPNVRSKNNAFDTNPPARNIFDEDVEEDDWVRTIQANSECSRQMNWDYELIG